MNRFISEKMRTIAPYVPNKPQCTIKLDANESNIPLNTEIMKAIAAKIEKSSLNRYPDPSAGEICLKYGEIIEINPECIVAGNGSDELISVICNFFTDYGDKVLSFTPDFSMYSFYAQVKGIECIQISKDEDMVLTPKMVIEACKKHNPRIVMFSNPCNPTGIGLSVSEIEEILNNVSCLVVVDEAYMEFWNESVIPLAGKYDNLIILRTCSKAWAAAGIRLGFAISNKELSAELFKAKSPYNVSVLTQAAASVMFDCYKEIRKAAVTITDNKKYLYNRLCETEKANPNKIHVFNSNANFVFIRCKNAQKIDSALREEGILIRRFGDEYLRVTAGTVDEIDTFIAAFSKAIV